MVVVVVVAAGSSAEVGGTKLLRGNRPAIGFAEMERCGPAPAPGGLSAPSGAEAGAPSAATAAAAATIGLGPDIERRGGRANEPARLRVRA